MNAGSLASYPERCQWSVGSRSPTAAAFQLVELLGLLGALEIPSADAELDHAPLEEIRGKAVSAILELATAASSAAAIREAFSERNFSAYAPSALSRVAYTRWRTAIAKSAPAAPAEAP